MAPATVVIKRGRAKPLWFGHPWIYSEAIERVDGGVEPGDEGAVADHDARLLGQGLGGPRSPVRVRPASGGCAPAAWGGARGGPRPRVACRENGVRLEVEPLAGQKTGAFLDQRENRALVGALARGARVLDLYCYAGGFALAAARGGAGSLTLVDTAAR